MDDFWKRIRVGAPNDCWDWIKGKSPKGYGRYTKAKRNGMPSGAHQVSWILTYGVIPRGLYVLHTCDNPSCCNPNHLFLGTAKDNAEDKVRKGRQPRGEQIPTHKLTWDQVNDIRLDGRKPKDISKDYNISVVMVYLILKNKSWSQSNA
jgi:hypothetical protein